MDVLGIDIGTVSVKCVRSKGKKGALKKAWEYPFAGHIEDLGPILEDIRQKEGTNLEVRIALTSTEILKRTFTVPVLPKEELKEAVKWSVTKILSEPAEEYIHQVGPLGTIEEKGIRKEEMYFIGAKRSYIEALITLFEERGFLNLGLITDICAAYTHVAEELHERRGFAILDIGGRQTGLYIFHGKRLHLVREIFTAGESFTDALIAGMGSTFEEAESAKLERGLDQSSVPFLLPVLERLSGEVTRTINVYNQRYNDRPCEIVYLTGRGSRLRGLLERLGELLPFEVRRLPLVFPVEEEFLPAFFLSLKGEIANLLPKERRKRVREGVIVRWAKVATAGLILVICLFSMKVLSDLRALDLKIKLERRTLETKRAMIPKDLADPKGLAEQEEMLKEAKKADGTFLLLLKYLSYSLPQNLYLKEIGFDEEKGKGRYLVEIRGIALGEKEMADAYVMKFLLLLEKDSLLKDASLSGREWKELKGRRVMEFTIRGACEAFLEG
jgi:Tfp pilus assembly PilM family ATPase